VQGAAVGWSQFNVAEKLDTDENGLPDYWESRQLGGLGQDPSADPDEDNATNLDEYLNGTNPTNSDTEGDGTPDGWEIGYGLGPRLEDALRDPDRDDYTNIEEYRGDSDPTDPSSIPTSFAWISVSPDSQYFGTPRLGSASAAYSIVVSNVGTANLTVEGVALAGADASQFVVDGDLCSGLLLETTDTCSMAVRFVPISEGVKNASLEIASDDAKTPVVSIRLQGEPEPVVCAGDCDGDGDVTVNELIIGVNIALGSQPVERCEAVDDNEDGVCTVNELIRAVNAALGGC
jgi:hypothetical protein